MRLYDALQHDSELRTDLVTLLDGERERTFVELELLDANDVDSLRACKGRLDAIRQLRFLFLKEERKAKDHAARR